MIRSWLAAVAMGGSAFSLALAVAVALDRRERLEDWLLSVIPAGDARTSHGESEEETTSTGPGPRALALWAVLAALAGAPLGFRLAGPVGALIGLAGGPVLVRGLRARRASRARDEIELQVRDMLVALAAAVRAGLSVRRAFEEAAREADQPLRTELDKVLDGLRVGESLEQALVAMAGRLKTRDVRLLVTLLDVHRRTGGALPVLLDELASIIGQRVEGRRQLRALTAQGRASGAVLAVLPIAFVGLLSGTSGDGLGAFYRTPAGSGLLLAGLICEVVGFLWIRAIVAGREAR